MEYREVVSKGVVAARVAERALEGQVALLHVALEHDLRVRRDLDADRLPGDELDRLALEEARRA